MDNFLYNIRNNSNKRFDRTRKDYRGHNNNRDRNSGNMRKEKSQRKENTISDESFSLLTETVQAIKTFLKSSIAHQKHMADLEERIVRSQELTANSMAMIASSFTNQDIPVLEKYELSQSVDNNSIFENNEAIDSIIGLTQEFLNTESPEMGHEESKAFDHIAECTEGNKETADKETTLFDRKDLIETIKQLRDNNMSFKKIAEYFDTEKISTFSGKGKWHATTISNLLKESQESPSYT